MEVLALLSNSDESIIPDVKSLLRRYTVYPLKTKEELEDLYSNIPLNLLLIDTTTCRLSSMEGFLSRLDDNMVILLSAETMDTSREAGLPASVYESINTKSMDRELRKTVERALVQQRMKHEVRLMREPGAETAPVQSGPSEDRRDIDFFCREPVQARADIIPGNTGRYVHERVIVNFAKMLTVSFDMRKLFDRFIDSVMEIARVSKMSVMLRDKDGFHVKTNYGLDPFIAENLTLGKDSALATWLSRTGRIMQRPSSYYDPKSVDIRKEMDFLQCSLSFPMIYKGRLIGIVNIDNKITAEPFYREELEIIYVLCNYLAAAVKDIDVYHQIWSQKEFTNNILSSVSSGMVAIDRDEKVTIFNQQAAIILGMNASDVIGRDLRELPSPLGDLMYETMVAGTVYKRHEVTVQPSGTPLGINSYRLLDEQHEPTGAGIVFSDLSDSRKLEQERRKAERLQAVNDLMAKIAHEVRNPLTSIQTYVQLLKEKNPDDDLNNFYIATVSQSISRLDTLIDKLVTFSSTQDYNLQVVDINEIIRDAESFIQNHMPQTHRFAKQMSGKVKYLNADRKQLVKAIYYLVSNIIDQTPDGTSITMIPDAELPGNAVTISLHYTGGDPIEKLKKELVTPILDVNHLGSELNIPLSHKIIEGHEGSLEMKQEGDVNSFIITLPAEGTGNPHHSVKGGRING